MKLYYTNGACSLVVRIIINEIGTASDFEKVDLRTKKTEKNADFLVINPKGSVPALEIDDQEILTENAVILQYLADNYKAVNLLPPLGDFRRYRVLEMLNFITTELHKSFTLLFNPLIPQEEKNSVIIPLIKKKFSYLDQKLQKTGPYLLGEKMSLPDPYLFVMLLWAHNFQISFSEFLALSRFFEDMKVKKSVKKSLDEEGLIIN